MEYNFNFSEEEEEYFGWRGEDAVDGWNIGIGTEDANTFDANAFEANAFDGNHFEANNFDGNNFEANAFDGNNFEANNFEANALDINALDINALDINALDATFDALDLEHTNKRDREEMEDGGVGLDATTRDGLDSRWMLDDLSELHKRRRVDSASSDGSDSTIVDAFGSGSNNDNIVVEGGNVSSMLDFSNAFNCNGTVTSTTTTTTTTSTTSNTNRTRESCRRTKVKATGHLECETVRKFNGIKAAKVIVDGMEVEGMGAVALSEMGTKVEWDMATKVSKCMAAFKAGKEVEVDTVKYRYNTVTRKLECNGKEWGKFKGWKAIADHVRTELRWYWCGECKRKYRTKHTALRHHHDIHRKGCVGEGCKHCAYRRKEEERKRARKAGK